MRTEPQDNSSLHAWSIATTITLLILLVGGGYLARDAMAGPSRPRGPDLDKLEAIEASIAYKKSPPKSQPQKPREEAPATKKIEGTSRDADKAPVDKPDDEPKAKPDDQPKAKPDGPVSMPDDDEPGPPRDPTNDFDEDRFGWAAETKGEPYVQDLLSDLIQAGGEYPSLAASEGFPIGCFHMDADGKILDTLMRERSDNAELDDFAERALNGLKKKRNADPIPIPLDNDKLRPLMTEWTCFRFNLGS